MRDMTTHLPEAPHLRRADTSMKTSEYSSTVSQIFSLSAVWCLCRGSDFLMMLSLNKTSKLEIEYTNSDTTAELLIRPEINKSMYFNILGDSVDNLTLEITVAYQK